MRKLILVFSCLILPCLAMAKDPQHASGLAVPRFVALKSGDVNVRTGPGTRYPIQWVFKREGWPVEVVEEFDQWRKIRDEEGTVGWVHKAMLDSRRTVLVLGPGPRTLRADPKDGAHAVLKAAPGVLARLAECHGEWCKVQVATHKGWLRRAQLWGVYPQEELK